MKKKFISILIVGAITLGSVGVADAATSFVKAYLVKSSVTIDGKKVTSSVYKIKKDYYIKAKSLKTGNIDSSVSSNKIVIKNKLNEQVKGLQTQINTLKPKVAVLQSQVNTLNPKVSELQRQVNTLNPKVSELQRQVNELKANIEKLTIGEDKQIDLTTGFYTVGLDLPEGTYTINAKSGLGSLVIYDASDSLLVLEMMGLDQYGTPVIHNVRLDKGSRIEIKSKVILTFGKKY
ncbi:hypothetical protein [Bacillus sp. X1(2014)]|uniref:hypothetical protein n=1 Tax=Bacillus sp. X1(2014) TaxID=1565991 RepID=UPI00119DF531|nr:hypothetical protein [Bacillus sp. X1(2014)]